MWKLKLYHPVTFHNKTDMNVSTSNYLALHKKKKWKKKKEIKRTKLGKEVSVCKYHIFCGSVQMHPVYVSQTQKWLWHVQYIIVTSMLAYFFLFVIDSVKNYIILFRSHMTLIRLRFEVCLNRHDLPQNLIWKLNLGSLRNVWSVLYIVLFVSVDYFWSRLFVPKISKIYVFVIYTFQDVCCFSARVQCFVSTLSS